MAITYEPIVTTTTSGTPYSVTLSSIPSTYTDLRIVFSNLTTTAGAVNIHWNSDSGSNYSSVYMGSSGSTGATQSFTNDSRVLVMAYQYGNSNTIPTTSIIDVLSYTGSKFKTAIVMQANDYNGLGGVASVVSMWRSTSAISSILIDTNGNPLNNGIIITVYGIKAA